MPIEHYADDKFATINVQSQAAGQLFRQPTLEDVGNPTLKENLRAWRHIEVLISKLKPRSAKEDIDLIAQEIQALQAAMARYSVYGSYAHSLLGQMVMQLGYLAGPTP